MNTLAANFPHELQYSCSNGCFPYVFDSAEISFAYLVFEHDAVQLRNIQLVVTVARGNFIPKAMPLGVERVEQKTH
jgi:hypothetical protein